MEMTKNMQKLLEQLLNKLIEKGWKPKNRERYWEISKCKVMGISWYVHIMFLIKWEERWSYGLNIRELVAKDTGLWQFVCENGLMNKNVDYRLIETALLDESELEKFLLDNIKI